jgi:hypothetical protein
MLILTGAVKSESNLKITDGFLPQEVFNELQNLLMGDYFPWFYNDCISWSKEGYPDNDYQFVHVFFNSLEPQYLSSQFQALTPLLDKLKIKDLLKLKANQNPNNNGEQLGYYHHDVDVPDSVTSILYLNTNDGYTKFEDGALVKSVANRLVTFDSQLEHVGFGCTQDKRRVLININYTIDS